MEILDLQGLELPQEENHDNASTLSVLNCGNSTVSTLLCL